MSFEVSTTPPKVRRIFEDESSMPTGSSPSSTSFWISATALRGTITPGMPSAPAGAAMSTRASRWPSVATARSIVRRSGRLDGVEEDAVEVVARLLGRDRELRLVDEAPQVRRRQRELERHLARREIGEVALGQGLQHEARAARADLHLAGIAGRLERDLRAFRKLADDVVDDVRRDRRRAALGGIGRDRLGDLDVEVGRLEPQARRRRRAGARSTGSGWCCAARRRDAHARAIATAPLARP